MDTTGRVGQDEVGTSGRRVFNGVEDHRAGVGALRSPHYRRSGAIGPHGQLVGRGGPEGIASREHQVAASGSLAATQLPDGGRLAHPVHTDEQPHRGTSSKGQRAIGATQTIHEDRLEDFQHPVDVVHAFTPDPLADLVQQLVSCRHADVGQDEGVTQFLPDVLVDHLGCTDRGEVRGPCVAGTTEAGAETHGPRGYRWGSDPNLCRSRAERWISRPRPRRHRR